MSSDYYNLGCFAKGDIVIAMWMSSAENASPFTATGIANAIDGYVTGLEQDGQATTSVGTNFPQASPYSTRLRLLTDISKLINRKVTLMNIRFLAYDTTNNRGAAGPYQDAATLAAITDSIDPTAGTYSLNDAYMQSRFKDSMIGGWQPNWFRPQFLINGNNILFGELASTFYADGSHLGDRSIGLPLPCCFDMELDVADELRDIEVFAQAAQKVGANYQRYAVQCIAVFRINPN